MCCSAGDPEIQSEQGFDVASKTLVDGYNIQSKLIPKVLQKSLNQQKKSTWESPLDFLMSCLSFAVGLGNIWRFPFKAAQHGGGSFLIPYIIVVTLIGRPLFYLELILGQFNSVGPIKCWNMCPLFRGVGVGVTMISFIVTTYYTVLLSWTLSFLYFSFFNPLPWKNRTSDFFRVEIINLKTKEEFSAEGGLGGPPNFGIALGLLASWCVVLMVFGQGVIATGKFAYLTAIFPFVTLSILLVRACLLENAGEGIWYFLKPDFLKVFSIQTWLEATGQAFFSLGTTFGQCTSFSSLNRFHHNIKRDTLFVAILDTAVSFMAGVVVFAVLGNVSHKTNRDIEDLIRQEDFDLAFVAFPAALETMGSYPSPQIFSVIFFGMLVTLALGSLNGLVVVFFTVASDIWPILKSWTILITCTMLGFLVGLTYTTPAGQYILQMLDAFISNGLVLLFGLIQVIGVSFAYGLKNFAMDVEFMFDSPVSIYWLTCWGVIMPVVLSVVTITTFWTVRFQDFWPIGLRVFGVTVVVLIALTIPAFGFLAVATSNGANWKERLKASILPTDDFGPVDPENRARWLHFRQERSISFSFREIYKEQLCCWLKKKSEAAEDSPSSSIQPSVTILDDYIEEAERRMFEEKFSEIRADRT